MTDLEKLGRALDEQSSMWLEETYPTIAEAVAEAVEQGARPEKIKRYVLGHIGRLELALRCEQAARHLWRLAGS